MNGKLDIAHIEEAIDNLALTSTEMHEIRISCNDKTPPELAELDQYRGQHHDCWHKLWDKMLCLVRDGFSLVDLEQTCRPSIVRVEENG